MESCGNLRKNKGNGGGATKSHSVGKSKNLGGVKPKTSLCGEVYPG